MLEDHHGGLWVYVDHLLINQSDRALVGIAADESLVS